MTTTANNPVPMTSSLLSLRASAEPALLHGIAALEVGGQGLCLQSLPGKADWYCSFAPGWRGVLLLDQKACLVVGGSAACRTGDISVLTKLQALLDQDLGIDVEARAGTMHVVQAAGEGLAALIDRR